MSEDERPVSPYAEGQREAAECRKCGQPIWIVYHGPQQNHTVEPRGRDRGLTPEEAKALITDPPTTARMREARERGRAKLQALASGGVEGETDG